MSKKSCFFTKLCRNYCLNLGSVYFHYPTFPPSVWIEEKGKRKKKFFLSWESQARYGAQPRYRVDFLPKILIWSKLLAHSHFCINNHKAWQEHNFLSSYSHLSQWKILHSFNCGSNSAAESILDLKRAYEK